MTLQILPGLFRAWAAMSEFGNGGVLHFLI